MMTMNSVGVVTKNVIHYTVLVTFLLERVLYYFTLLLTA